MGVGIMSEIKTGRYRADNHTLILQAEEDGSPTAMYEIKRSPQYDYSNPDLTLFFVTMFVTWEEAVSEMNRRAALREQGVSE